MVIDLESLCLVWMIGVFLYCVIRFAKTKEEPTKEEKIQKEFDLQRKYDVHSLEGHKIKALYYKILLRRYKK